MNLELVRQQWSDGNRRVEQSRSEPQQYARLLDQVEVMLSALRRRVGQSFTLAELAQTYERADDWPRFVLDEATPEGSPAPDAATVADAAFHLYARGASDYTP